MLRTSLPDRLRWRWACHSIQKGQVYIHMCSQIFNWTPSGGDRPSQSVKKSPILAQLNHFFRILPTKTFKKWGLLGVSNKRNFSYIYPVKNLSTLLNRNMTLLRRLAYSECVWLTGKCHFHNFLLFSTACETTYFCALPMHNSSRRWPTDICDHFS